MAIRCLRNAACFEMHCGNLELCVQNIYNITLSTQRLRSRYSDLNHLPILSRNSTNRIKSRAGRTSRKKGTALVQILLGSKCIGANVVT